MKPFSLLPVTCHTDFVGTGSTFVAIKGYTQDGACYIADALKKGATQIVIDKDTQLDEATKDLIEKSKAQLRVVPSTRKALSELSAEAHGYPADDLTIIGVTGTKGKTTTCYLLEHILRSAGHKTALLGTITNRILDQEYQATLTTPQPDYLHAFLAQCREQGVRYVVMEAAAQAASVHRLDNVLFDTLIFTNFSLEHSEFYESLDDYFAAKCKLFARVKNGRVVLNADDPRVSTCVPDWPQRHTISMHGKGIYNGTLRESTLSSLKLELTTQNERVELVSSQLLGEFSGYNLLAAFAVAEHYGLTVSQIQDAVSSFKGVPGRICKYALPNGSVALIDNAHTPSSFEAFFKAVRPLSHHIIAVFGAGGDRDALKRPLMGAIATKYADEVILTMDNPRSEDVESIIDDIVKGIKDEEKIKVHKEVDRERAIRLAYAHTKAGSLLVLLGKGPVEYQHIGDKKIPFSEATILSTLQS